MDPKSHFFSTFLEFIQHFPQLFYGGRKKQHIFCKSQVGEAVLVVVAEGKYIFFFVVIVEDGPSVSIEEPCGTAG